MKPRRLAFAVVLAVLLVVAVVAGNASARRAGPAATAPASTTAADDAVWFCPGAPAQYQHRNGVVTFSNLGVTVASVAVTDLADTGPATHVSFSIGPRSVLSKTRDQLGAPGALTIETFGSRVVVEDGVDAAGAVDSAPCAPGAAPHAYFAAGTTVRGVQQWLVLQNPFASDAKVDIALQTDSGLRRPDKLQGLDIARRSRYVIAIDTLAVRMARVAVEVDARVGTVVAAQTLVYTKDAGTPGVAMAVGAPEAGDSWSIAAGTTPPNSNVWLAIANVGNDDAQVDVEVHTTAKQPVTPGALTVAQGNVAWLQLGRCSSGAGATCVRIPDNARYSVEVHSEQHVPVVAGLLGHLDDKRSTVGVVTPMAQPKAATEWDFARARVSDLRATSLFVYNPGATAAVVNVGLVRGGRVDTYKSLRNVAVAPGQTVAIPVMDSKSKVRQDAAITVQSTQPVVVTRLIAAGSGTSASTGTAAGTPIVVPSGG